VREHAGPPEHRGERDHLEQREIDRRGDEEPCAREQEHEDEGGRDRQAPVQTVQQYGRGDEQCGEAEDHHAGDLVVQVLVGVEGNAAHEREVHADHGEADQGDGRGSPAART
jgi:hypothetical protein